MLRLLAALALGTALAVPARADATPPSPPAAHQAQRGHVLRHTVVSGADRYRLRLHPVDLRGPHFAVLAQQADGSLQPVDVGPTRAYAGSVVGVPSAVAVAVRRRDGGLAGQVTIDGRETLFFDGREVTGTDGTDRPAYHWPSADDPALDRTVKRSQIEPFTRQWEVGYDLDHSYLGGELGGSVDAAMDGVELTTVEMLATYESDARLRPAIGRVVLRSTQATSPYAGREAELSDVRAQWDEALDDDVVDTVAYLHSDGDGGGVAYVGTVGGDYAVSLDGSGNDIAIIRHELGHTWGPHDDHTNGPEGQTIMSGNDYARFDGTELAAILTTRDERLEDSPGRFPKVRTSRVQLPPYATLDLRDHVHAGATVRVRPTANDLDANGDRVQLRSVPRRSHLGARLRTEGDRVVYRAPRGSAPGTVDWFRYTVSDGHGGVASGVVVLRTGRAG